MANSESADRCAGVLIGLAAGDRIGGPTQMAVRVAESLIKCRYLDASEIRSRYLAWWREGAFDTGPVSDLALRLIHQGVSPDQAPALVHQEFGGQTAGCNPVHRNLPLAIAGFLNDDDLAECARVEARLTHFDPLAGDIAAIANRIARALIRGATWDAAARQHAAILGREGPLSNGGFAPQVLQAAAYFVSTSDTFSEALQRSIAFAGPANYCPVLAGALAGARWGASSIQADQLSHVEPFPQIRQAAEALAATW